MKEGNFAFIDSQNVHLGIRSQSWSVDWLRLRKYLSDRFHIVEAYYFVGYTSQQRSMYHFLNKCGYTLIFKPTAFAEWKMKGNVDVELTLHTILQREHFEKALIISGDGDFYSLIEYLISINKLQGVLIPDMNKYSSFLNDFLAHLIFMNKLKSKIEYKKSP